MFDTPGYPYDGEKYSPKDTDIPYHIAGKDVKLPYGFPEESIFILTASYRYISVVSTYRNNIILFII